PTSAARRCGGDPPWPGRPPCPIATTRRRARRGRRRTSPAGKRSAVLAVSARSAAWTPPGCSPWRRFEAGYTTTSARPHTMGEPEPPPRPVRGPRPRSSPPFVARDQLCEAVEEPPQQRDR